MAIASASVSAISLRHILASPGYAPVTIAVNVHGWKEDSMLVKCIATFSIDPSIFNRLRAIARYWSEIATFSSPLAFNALLGCSQWNSGKTFGPNKTRIMGLPGSEDNLRTGSAVSTQYQRVTDRRYQERGIARTQFPSPH